MNIPAGRRPAEAAVLRIVLLFCLATCVPGGANADGINGFMELGYSFSDTEARTADGQTIRSEGRDLSQRYQLTLDRRFYPNLLLRAGGLFERVDTTSEAAGSKDTFTSTRINPSVDLTLATPLYTAGAGYNRREEKQESGGSKNQLNRDTYNATFSWKPVDFPTLDLRYNRDDTYDPGRVTKDLTSDSFQVSSRYLPVKSLELTYQGTFNQQEDRIGGVTSKDTTHSGRVTYDDRFLKDRISLHANYDISVRNTETRASAGGEVTSLVQVFGGLFALDDTPLEGGLPPNTPEGRALVDGNLTASTGIDIGWNAQPRDLQGLAPRNMGLDFLLPDVQVNGLLVWVDNQLPVQVAGLFRWDVYVSTDNQVWNPVPGGTGLSATFGTFENRFEVRFPSVRTRFVKVTVAPLPPTVITVPGALSFPHIFVTELQATLTLPAEEAKRESSLTSHLVNVAARARLLDVPSLFYNFSLLYSWTDPASVSRLLLSNGLSLNQRLNRWLTTSAQAAWDLQHEPSGDRQSYRYGISLSATPLRTLSHNLVYSGTTDILKSGGTEVRNSVFLSNRAMLYQGISVFLNGGVSQGHLETGERTRNYLVNFSSDISPHPTMTWSLAGSADRAERTGGIQPDSTTSTRRARVSLSWNPLPAVNLFGSTERVERDQVTTTLYNASLNWSPLRDGALQMSFTANETLRPEEDGSDRLIVPSLRWEVRSGVSLDLSYAFIQSKTRTLETDSRVGSAVLRAYF